MATDRVQRRPGSHPRRDQGFTLTELLISVVVMGLLATTLAGVAIVVLNTTPPTEARADDARSLQGLVTWLPQDVDATPPDGFDRSATAWPCAGAAPANSVNILTMGWTEQSTVATDYSASYRYEKRNESWSMVRYFCTNHGAAERINLTSSLPAWPATLPAPPAHPPAYVVMCSVVVKGTWSDQGNCPAGDTYPDAATAPDPVRSLKMFITLGNGLFSTIDAAPKNPDQSLADDPDAVANQKPTVANTAFTLTIPQGTTQVYDLGSYMGAVNDPDGPNSQLSIASDDSEPAPLPGFLTFSTAYTATTQFQLTLTAAANTPTSPDGTLFMLVSDVRSGWAPITVTIDVVPAVNPLPVAGLGASRTVTVKSPEAFVMDVVNYFGITDDDPVLTVTVDAVVPILPVIPGDITVTKTNVHEITINLASGYTPFAGSPAGTVAMTISDGDGGVLPLSLTVVIEAPADVNDPPIYARQNVNVTIQAGQSVAVDVTTPAGHGVTDPDVGDALSVSLQSTPSGITPTITGTTATLAAAANAVAGLASSPVVLRVSDTSGAHVDVTVTVTVTAPPPPPPSCTLNSLTATPNPIARQGSGTGARHLSQNVTITLTYTGSCDGLRLNYDSGDGSGLGTGPGRTFPPGSPTSVQIFGNGTGGTEKFTPGPHVLTASTTTAVTPNSITKTLTVT